MAIFISLLRGINVSGKRTIRMAELHALYSSLQLQNVTTYLQSGNVVFDSPELDRAMLARRIEAAIEHAFGYTVAVLLRDREDLQRVVSQNPFLDGRQEAPSKLHVTFLAEAPAEATWANLPLPPETADEFIPRETEVYLFCPGGYGKTVYSNRYFERWLKVSATTRNWKTVTALYDLASAR